MRWDDLRFFLAVARSGSLADAARVLRTSPATVGRRITALEARLGTRLFDRSKTGYSTTEAGDAIRIRAEELENSVTSIERSAVGRDLRPAGTVRLASAIEIVANVLAPHLKDFRQRYPEIVLDVIGDIGIANLLRREADIALRTVRPQNGDLVVRRVGSWKCGLYAAKSYVEMHNLALGLRNFSNLDIITWTETHADLRAGRWFDEHAPAANIVLRANSRRIHYSACKAGIGIAILPCLMADRDPDLIQLRPAEKVFISDLYLVVHRDLTETGRVRAVIDFFCERISKSTL